MKHATKIAIVTLLCLSTSACDLWSSLEGRDVGYNDQVCHPNANGACW